VPPEPACAAPRAVRHLRVVAPRPLKIADVALFYGERSGGIRTYLDAKARYAALTGAFEHHVLVPGPRELHEGGHHELRSLRVIAANGYRVPLSARALKATLRELAPDVVLLHDPFWGPAAVAACAREIGARTVAVHHGSVDLEAAALPGPSHAYAPMLRVWQRRAARHVDAIMSNVDTTADCGRMATLPLGLGVGEAFRPRARLRRHDHVLYVGRFSREKGVLELLEAAARSAEPWPLRLVGSGPLEETLRARARRLRLGTRISFHPHISDADALAACLATARCVAMPGEHETFGLVALEAAACGTPVAGCATAPAMPVIGGLGHRFVPGDPADLGRAIEDARAAGPDPEAGATLAWRHGWDRVFRDELERLEALVA
jgi:alpha-1,6-mannosyltransferase